MISVTDCDPSGGQSVASATHWLLSPSISLPNSASTSARGPMTGKARVCMARSVSSLRLTFAQASVPERVSVQTPMV